MWYYSLSTVQQGEFLKDQSGILVLQRLHNFEPVATKTLHYFLQCINFSGKRCRFLWRKLEQSFLQYIIFFPSFFFFFFFFFVFFFIGPHLQHMEIPRLGVESELQLLAYTTATAMQDPSRACNLHHSSRQCQIPNPLNEARD